MKSYVAKAIMQILLGRCSQSCLALQSHDPSDASVNFCERHIQEDHSMESRICILMHLDKLIAGSMSQGSRKAELQIMLSSSLQKLINTTEVNVVERVAH